MGTAQDMLDLLDGDAARAGRAGAQVARLLGFTDVFTSVGQVYPRSLDHDVVSALVQVGAGPSSFAHTIRLMAGHELVTEGFAARPGRLVGDAAQDEHPLAASASTACRSCCADTAPWPPNSPARSGTRATCSARWCAASRCRTRSSRIDGLTETFLTVLDEFGAYPAVIQRELDRYLPFLATTSILIAAVRAGVGRETAHEVIKEHAVAVALAMRERGARARSARPSGRRPAAAAGPGRPSTRRSPTSRRSPARRPIRSTGWSRWSTT